VASLISWCVIRLYTISKEWIQSILGKWMLILGDVGTGKTRFTSEITEKMIDLGYGDDITVIDLGPETGEVGSTLASYLHRIREVRYLHPAKLYAPRLMARDISELNKYMDENYRMAKEVMEKYRLSPTKILVINDLTIFLHRGSVDELMDIIKISETFIGNAYYGSYITDKFNTGIDIIERMRVEELIKHMDIVIDLNKGDDYHISVEG